MATQRSEQSTATTEQGITRGFFGGAPLRQQVGNLAAGFGFGYTTTSLTNPVVGCLGIYAASLAHARHQRQQGDVMGDRTMLFALGAVGGWAVSTLQRPSPADSLVGDEQVSNLPTFGG